MSLENIGATEQKKNNLSLFAILVATYLAMIVFDVFVIGSVGTLLKVTGIAIIGLWVFYFFKNFGSFARGHRITSFKLYTQS